MSRFRTLLVAASLAAAPISALAAPPLSNSAPPAAAPPHQQMEHFEWSMSTGHGRLGIEIMGLSPELRTYFGAAQDRGVLVAHVEPGSAAAKAGIAVGDVVIAVGGKTVSNAGDVIAALDTVKKGQTAAIDVIRAHQQIAVRPTLTDDPAPFEAAQGFPDRDWFDNMFDHAWPVPSPHRSSNKT
jgi:S1-C subfamily serine protease